MSLLEYLKKYQERIKGQEGGEVSPHELADMRLEMSHLYGSIDEGLLNILKRKPATWNEMRKSFKSDTACERAWQQTPDGIREIELRHNLKTLEKMMSSVKTMLEVMSVEARNSY